MNVLEHAYNAGRAAAQSIVQQYERDREVRNGLRARRSRVLSPEKILIARELLAQLCQALTERELRVLWLRYVRELPRTEIAKDLGKKADPEKAICPQTVFLIERKALRKARRVAYQREHYPFGELLQEVFS